MSPRSCFQTPRSCFQTPRSSYPGICPLISRDLPPRIQGLPPRIRGFVPSYPGICPLVSRDVSPRIWGSQIKALGPLCRLPFGGIHFQNPNSEQLSFLGPVQAPLPGEPIFRILPPGRGNQLGPAGGIGLGKSPSPPFKDTE